MDSIEKSKEEWSAPAYYSQHPSLRKLTALEKSYLLAVEHGDATKVEKILQMAVRSTPPPLDINCKDAVGRSATQMAIDNENLDMLVLVLNHGVESRDALLHAIKAEYVEGVDLLLEHEEIVHKEGEPHSWEKVDRDISTFTPEITPLILAAHHDNYEILKLLLDRGSTLPMPHDVRCKCNECVTAMEQDCLYHSRSRINAYRALSSPSLICLSSIDPILTAFELSWELKRLSFIENEFKEDYKKLRFRCQDFATNLLDHARSSSELEVILNYDPTKPPYQQGDHMPLSRVQMAIKYKQKKFIAHPNVQQLMSTLWYDGLPGFRKQNAVQQLWDIIKIGLLFPFYSCMYMLFPNNSMAKLIRKPFFKFIIHSFSYLFFLFLLILASQRVETLVVQWFGSEEMKLEFNESIRKQRGRPPTILETSILLYIVAHIWQETRELWSKGLVDYFQNMWNIIDFTRNSLYVATVGMRLLSYFQAQGEIYSNPLSAYIPRELWNAFDPMLIADGMFAAANVFAALKLIHIFSINPYLGPLQISLGRMVIDIIKFFFIYALVLFAFACGLNQLLWYYADLEKQQCFSGPGGTENWATQRDSCLTWSKFSNLFESSQSLFWASFGLVDLSVFELKGIKSYTRFWGLLMFGSYSVINVVVLLNLLIAMMSNSYNLISERADVEWKFARTQLFMNYFEEGSTVPPPFNLFPTMKNLMRLCGRKRSPRDMSLRRKETKLKERDSVYQPNITVGQCPIDWTPTTAMKAERQLKLIQRVGKRCRQCNVMCNLVWRYVTAQQKDIEGSPVTEDHINEVKQEVQSFKHDLMRVLRTNGMQVKDVEMEKPQEPVSVKIQVMKRRLIKDFSIGLMEVCTEGAAPEVKNNKGVLARLVGLSGNETSTSQRWRDLIQAAKRSKIIGNKEKSSSRFDSLRQSSVRSQDDEGSNGCINEAYTEDETLQQSARPDDSYRPLVNESPYVASPTTKAPEAPLTSISTLVSPQKKGITESPAKDTEMNSVHEENTLVISQSKSEANLPQNLIDLQQGNNIMEDSKHDKMSSSNIKCNATTGGIILSPQKLMLDPQQEKAAVKKETVQQKAVSPQKGQIPGSNAPKRQTTPKQGVKKSAAPAKPDVPKPVEIKEPQEAKAHVISSTLDPKSPIRDPPAASQPDTTIVVPSTPDSSPKRSLLALPKATIVAELSAQRVSPQAPSVSNLYHTEKQNESVLISLNDQSENKTETQGAESQKSYVNSPKTLPHFDPQMLPCTTEVELRSSSSSELGQGADKQAADEKEDSSSNLASTLKSGYVKIMEYRKGWI